ncbi:MAG: DnaJ domain-containing protein, partial [Nitrospirota bacterium]|nr:DnaJ domain-containing protein [Nitrospirota bacterium]
LGGELSEIAAGIDSFDGIGTPQVQASTESPEALSALEDALRDQWESMKGKNYYEVFGMTAKTFSFDKLKKSYFELTKTYGPEKFFASTGEVMSLAEDFLSMVSNAYSTLSNVVTKEHYDEVLSSQIPTGEEEKKFFEKVQFQSGKVMLEQGQYEGAEKAFTNCMTIDPNRAEYLAYLAFATYHNPANKGSAADIKRAKDMVNKSLVMEKFPIAYALKGTMLLDEGLLNLAEAEFGKALKLNPNNKIALKSMEFIRQRREEEKKGFFQRMFK